MKNPKDWIPVEPEKIPKILMDLIRRREDCLTPTEIARKVGIGQNNILNWLNGKNIPRLDLFCRVLDDLGKRLVIVDKEEYD